MGRRKILLNAIKAIQIVAIMVLSVISIGCASLAERTKPALIPTERGTVIFQGKYEFQKPPEGWLLIRSDEGGDFEMGFIKFEKGDFPSQTTFIYDDQPFGSHQDLGKRAKYYSTRFLFNSGIVLRVTKEEKLKIQGQEAVAIYIEGENLNRNEKSKSKVYLIKKGKRIISFVCTQWRPLKGSFSQESFEQFEFFVQSFKFLQKDFYEKFEEKLKEIGL